MNYRRAMVDRRVRYAGGGLTVTLRRNSTLRHAVTQAAVASLTLAAAASAGETLIDLVAANMTGELVAGAQVTIAAAVYTTLNSVRAADGGLLAGVQLSPVLAGSGAIGAAAEVTRSYSDAAYSAMRTELAQEGLDGWVEGASKSYRLSAANDVRAPEERDVVSDGAARKELVKRVRILEPGSDGAIGWQVWVGVGT